VVGLCRRGRKGQEESLSTAHCYECLSGEAACRTCLEPPPNCQLVVNLRLSSTSPPSPVKSHVSRPSFALPCPLRLIPMYTSFFLIADHLVPRIILWTRPSHACGSRCSSPLSCSTVSSNPQEAQSGKSAAEHETWGKCAERNRPRVVVGVCSCLMTLLHESDPFSSFLVPITRISATS
jgi:hypothetical protein